jgi:mRNA-degrading endonuclease YafQ of YafQ-DinJ toxin-antitoxin module
VIEIAFYPAFIKTYKKKIKNNSVLKSKFNEKFVIFKNNPYDLRLKTHKLTGSLKELYSFSIDYDNRVIFSFYSKNRVIFEDIGNHDEVY